MTTESISIFACDLTHLTSDERTHLGELSTEVFGAVQMIREFPEGYAFQLSQESKWLPTLADFIRYDRLCCPFISHGIQVEPNGGHIWLRLFGEDGVKPFIVAEVGHFLSDEVAQGFR